MGTALGALLSKAGFRVVAFSCLSPSTAERARAWFPGASWVPPEEAAAGAGYVALTLPDDWISPVVDSMALAGAFRVGQRVFHTSGATSISVLAPAREAGAEVAVVHPLQTVPDPATGMERIPGSPFAVTVDGEGIWAMELVRAVGGIPFRLEEEGRALYHAAAVLAAAGVASVFLLAARLAGLAGLEGAREALRGLSLAALENASGKGAQALTGPWVRGDVGTVRGHLEALERLQEGGGRAAEIYRLLGLLALGELGFPEALRKVEEVLSGLSAVPGD